MAGWTDGFSRLFFWAHFLVGEGLQTLPGFGQALGSRVLCHRIGERGNSKYHSPAKNVSKSHSFGIR